MDIGQIMMQLLPQDSSMAGIQSAECGPGAGLEGLFGELLGHQLLDLQAADMPTAAGGLPLEDGLAMEQQVQQPDMAAIDNTMSQMMAQLSAYQAILATAQPKPAEAVQVASVPLPEAIDVLVAVPTMVVATEQQATLPQAAELLPEESLPVSTERTTVPITSELNQRVQQRRDVGRDSSELPAGGIAELQGRAIPVERIPVKPLTVQQQETLPVGQEAQPARSAEPQRVAQIQQELPVQKGVASAAGEDVQNQSVVQLKLVKNNAESAIEARKAEQVRFAQPADVTAAADSVVRQGSVAADAAQDDGQPSSDLMDTAGQLVEKAMPETAQGRHSSTANVERFHMASPVQHQPLETLSGDEVRLTTVPEQVSRRVVEHLRQQEIRQGQEQITLKLSPENLGNLQLNLKMEDQRLKLEIVTEQRGVRDVLLQQAEELKESLSRQNIRMDSFDVTTGTGSSLSQQSQDWRRMATEYQPPVSRYGGGSVVKGMVAGVQPTMQYFAPQYQSTIDVRF